MGQVLPGGTSDVAGKVAGPTPYLEFGNVLVL